MPCDPEPIKVLVGTAETIDVGRGPQPEYEVRAGYRSHFGTHPGTAAHRKG